jgi:hypothetical protein
MESRVETLARPCGTRPEGRNGAGAFQGTSQERRARASARGTTRFALLRIESPALRWTFAITLPQRWRGFGKISPLACAEPCIPQHFSHVFLTKRSGRRISLVLL